MNTNTYSTQAEMLEALTTHAFDIAKLHFHHAKAGGRGRFTAAQVAACSLLREYLRLDFRALERLISGRARLLKILDLTRAPDYSTFSRRMSKLSSENVRSMANELSEKIPPELHLAIMKNETSGGLHYVRETGTGPVTVSRYYGVRGLQPIMVVLPGSNRGDRAVILP